MRVQYDAVSNLSPVTLISWLHTHPDYNPEAALVKRKPAEAKKEPAAKKPKVDVNDDNFDMGSFVDKRTVEKLTVAQLKSYLTSVDILGVAGKKKAELVQAVYAYYDKR